MSVTHAVLDVAELQDGQMKQVAFGENGKVLLSRLGENIYATSAFCTHYGAPLVSGTLEANGRVVCPWHGACFNVCTGDIEDAPAVEAIHSFKAEVADGKILVTANASSTLKEEKSRYLPINAELYSNEGLGIVIVGGGPGGFQAMKSLRENGYTKNITVLSSEPYEPIDRTKLSKTLITDENQLKLQTTKAIAPYRFYPGVTVTRLDTKEKLVFLDNGEKIPYESVVLATGGTPRRLPVPGADLYNVFTFRNVRDSSNLDQSVKEGSRLAVIGSSFIGMELVSTLSKRKLASIDVISMEDYPFQRVLGVEIGKGIKMYHEIQGITFHPGAKVNQIRASTTNPKLATGVELADGTFIAADNIILGVGVAPATGFLKKSGIKLESDGGVKVDEYLRVIGYDDVYAIGDIAVYPESFTGVTRHVRIEHWNVASNHGRAVGRTIMGKGTPFQKVPLFWSSQGGAIRYAGNGVGYEDVIIKGDPSELKFIAYYIKGDRVIAVASMGRDPVVVKCSELLRLGLMPKASEIRDGKDPLTVDISTTAAKVKSQA